MTEEKSTAVLLRWNIAAAVKYAAIALGLEMQTRNPAPALGTGAHIAAVSIYPKYSALTDHSYTKDPRHEL